MPQTRLVSFWREVSLPLRPMDDNARDFSNAWHRGYYLQAQSARAWCRDGAGFDKGTLQMQGMWELRSSSAGCHALL